MKVAICYTKTTKKGKRTCDSFAEGVRGFGDEPILIKKPIDVARLANEPFDVVVQLCGYSPHQSTNTPDAKFRKIIHNLHKSGEYPWRLILIDRGYLWDDDYESISFDAIKANGKFYNENSTPDRWAKLSKTLTVKPWRKIGKHILLLGQASTGASCYKIDLLQWYRDIIYKLKKNSKRKIILRLHPGEKPWLIKQFIDLAKNCSIEVSLHKFNRKTGFSEESLMADLTDAWAVVGYNSGALLKAIIRGIPVLFPDKSFVGYNVSNHSIKNIENPILYDRSQFFNDLAYTMWHYKDMYESKPWQHLRNFVNED